MFNFLIKPSLCEAFTECIDLRISSLLLTQFLTQLKDHVKLSNYPNENSAERKLGVFL